MTKAVTLECSRALLVVSKGVKLWYQQRSGDAGGTVSLRYGYMLVVDQAIETSATLQGHTVADDAALSSGGGQFRLLALRPRL